jgi:hypothetical protein
MQPMEMPHPAEMVTVFPISGMIVPEMGTKARARRGGLADALFTPVQQRVLGLLFGQPERRFQSAELIRLVKGGTGAVHRQLGRLAGAGLLDITEIGNQRHYQARRDSPVFTELHGLIVKTVGVADPLRRALAPLASRIREREEEDHERRALRVEETHGALHLHRHAVLGEGAHGIKRKKVRKSRSSR